MGNYEGIFGHKSNVPAETAHVRSLQENESDGQWKGDFLKVFSPSRAEETTTSNGADDDDVHDVEINSENGENPENPSDRPRSFDLDEIETKVDEDESSDEGNNGDDYDDEGVAVSNFVWQACYPAKLNQHSSMEVIE